MALAASLGGATISERADQGHWRAGNVTVHVRKAAGGWRWALAGGVPGGSGRAQRHLL